MKKIVNDFRYVMTFFVITTVTSWIAAVVSEWLFGTAYDDGFNLGFTAATLVGFALFGMLMIRAIAVALDLLECRTRQ